MLLTSLAIVVPLFVLAHLLLWDDLVWAGILVWWLKPAWERTHLMILGQALFGPAPGVRETLRSFPKVAGRQIGWWLSLRRLAPTRSFDLPVVQLEGLSKEDYRRRVELLRRGGASTAATWLLVVCANVEGFIALGVVVLVQILIPETSGANAFSWLLGLEDEGRGRLIILNAVSIGAAVLVAPFYVGSGFALYINRRTVLEGWDLEIAFRRLADRLERRSDRSSAAATVALVALVIVLVPLTVSIAVSPALAASHAIDSEPTSPDTPMKAMPTPSGSPGDMDLPVPPFTPEVARTSIRDILAREEFHQIETSRVPKLFADSDGKDDDESSWLDRIWEFLFGGDDEPARPPLPEWISKLIVLLVVFAARVSEIGLIALALGFLIYTLYRYRQDIALVLGGLIPASLLRPTPPVRLMGLEVTPESLPDDITSEVERLWQGGKLRAACGLLYRATLTELMHRHAVDFRSGDTERDCLSATASTGDVSPGMSRFLAELTHHWQLLAYGHRPPSTAVFESLRATWSRLFDSPPSAAGARRDG